MNLPAQSNNPIRKQKGFSLIESLVAFLILSVGMLGIASLQALSLKAGKTAALRTVAVIKVEEMLERIRGNPTVVTDYAVGIGGLGTLIGCNDYTSSPYKACTPAELAQDDIYYWKKELKDSLPDNAGTTASVEVVAPVPGVQPTAVVTVTVNWQERDPEAEAMINMSYTASSQICDSTAC